MEAKIKEQIRQVCEHILANASQVENPEVLTAARELLKAALESKEGMTVETLSNLIRRASDLEDLKHQVGPSAEESELAVRRLDKIDAIWRRNEKEHGCNPDLWPFHEKEAYDRLMAQQSEFERTYC